MSPAPKSGGAAPATASPSVTGNRPSEDTLASKKSSPLKITPIKEIGPGVQKLVEAYHQNHKLHAIQYRLNQLRNVYFALKDNETAFVEALEKDFYRAASETKNLELNIALGEIYHVMANLLKWSKPEKAQGVPLTMKANPIYIERIPLGVVLVISPFNYPLLLTVSSVIGALAGGNAVVLKASEQSPHFSQLLSDVLAEALDDDIFFAVNGAIPETTELLEQKFDKIIYTGNSFVGKIIAKKAAETLTPVLLELGGKSPAFVLDDVKEKDLAVIARRILWGRFTNGGQTCVAIDYVLVHDSIKEKLVEKIVEEAKPFFASLKSTDARFTHVIHDRAFANLANIIKNTKGKVVLGGEHDKESRFIAPTIISDVTWSDSSMRDELFGPVLPILSYKDLTTALREVVANHDTPLAQYVFTGGAANRNKNKQIDEILTFVRSGGAVINDSVIHVGLPNAPFGGVGNSGTGNYHGWYSFRAFTHERLIVESKLATDFALKVRYQPYSEEKDTFINKALRPQYEYFARSGDVAIGGPSTFFNIWSGAATVAIISYYLGSVL